MFTIALLVAFLVVLRHRGRLGPFVWAWLPSSVGPPPGTRRAHALADGSRDDAAERVLAGRLADGSISSEEYLERLSVLQSR